jgi:hypothetical protein
MTYVPGLRAHCRVLRGGASGARAGALRLGLIPSEEAHLMQFAALIRRNHDRFEITLPDLPGFLASGRNLAEVSGKARRAIRGRHTELARQGRALKPTPFDTWWPLQDLRGALATFVEVDFEDLAQRSAAAHSLRSRWHEQLGQRDFHIRDFV